MEEFKGEVERLVPSALRDRERQGRFDLEALELSVRELMHRCGAVVLERLLAHEDGSGAGVWCRCGGVFGNRKRRAKTIVTVLGEVRLGRTIQRCRVCGAWRAAQDVVLDVVGTGFSPGVRRMMARTGAEVPFDRARDLMGELAGVWVTDKDVERCAEAVGGDIARGEDPRVQEAMEGVSPECAECPSTLYVATDGTGVPVLRKETQGRVGKGPDGVARTREVKVGVVFTQTRTTPEGEAVRDPGSTTYVAKIEPVESFGPRLYAEALGRGLAKARRVVVLGDGAPWVWNLAQEQFPGAVQIVDFYHAQEHLAEMARAVFPEDEGSRRSWREQIVGELREGRVWEVVRRLGGLKVRGQAKELRDQKIRYFHNNRHRMRYGEFRRAGLFIGSGVVEAGCKSLIAQRLKQSGMRWTVRGANSIIALRCCIESRRFEDYWEQRRAA